MRETKSEHLTLKGIGGSPGICIGKAYIVDREGVAVVERYRVTEESVTDEINRFKDAVEKAKKDYAAVIEAMDDTLKAHLSILETHVLLFKDKMIYEKTIETIKEEKINAEWALKKVTRQIKNMFKYVDDPYLKSRANDISQVSERIMSRLVGIKDEKISDIDKRVILVAHDLSPADTSQIQLEKIKGFITDRGGKDSHTSIIAKSLKIPSVLGLGKATLCIKNEDILIVDGYSGTVIINPPEETLFKYEERRERFEKFSAELARSSHLPAVTKDGFEMSLYSNIELVEEVVAARDNGAEGIGLFRTEFLYIDLKRFPTEEELYSKYKEVVELIAPNPVTIRTLDINGDKVNPELSNTEEANPALGLRGVRFCLNSRDVFKTQLKAILRAAHYGNVKILIPMISCLREVIEVKELLAESVAELEKAGNSYKKDVCLGVMIEVPSAVVMADKFARHVDFFSIGTNDLIQYTMAIDRRNRNVAHLYQPLNPAVLRMLKQTTEAARHNKIPVTMCGEMAGDFINVPILIGLGIKELSMNSGAIPVVKEVIRNIAAAGTEEIVRKAVDFDNASDVYGMIMEKYRDIFPYKRQENNS